MGVGKWFLGKCILSQKKSSKLINGVEINVGGLEKISKINNWQVIIWYSRVVIFLFESSLWWSHVTQGQTGWE